MKINGFNERGEVIESLSVNSKGCFHDDGSPTAKIQTIMLHNHVYELTKMVDSLSNVIEDLEGHLVEIERRFAAAKETRNIG